MIVLGIDPGARATGLALVAFDDYPPRLLWSHTVYRLATMPTAMPMDPPLPVPLGYLERVFDIVSALRGTLRPDLIAVENITPPARATLNQPATVGQSATAPVLAASIVAGYCLTFGQVAPVTAVPEHEGTGTAVLGAYPEEVVAANERRHPQWRTRTGTGYALLRHVRAAYDITRLAHQTATQRPKVAG